jgi:hypothetical protein
MSYNMKELPNYINTAGKITVITSLIGVVVFAVIFLLNLGAQEFNHAEAQSQATTSVVVLNTPPQWTIDAQETPGSSTTTPTNSGSAMTWTARATDSNAENYYLLICSNGNAPTANPAAVPTCGASAVRWAVSAFTASGATSTAATTTTEAAPFAEQNDWYAWVCDAVATNPRCNSVAKQGTGGRMSPFNVNKRPTFTLFSDNSPRLPGQTVTFYSTSTDADTVPTNDTVRLFVCSTNSFDTSTDVCTATTLASTSGFVASNASASYTIPIPTQDQNYNAFGFVIDNHGHEASGGAQGTNSTLTVSNASPTISPAQITLNNGSNIILTQEAGQTTGFRLSYVATDNNSCENASAGDEIRDYVVSIYRSGIGSTTCNGSAGSYNANNCYPSGIATSTWNLSCAATTTPADCTGATDTTQTWECTFPLWYIADPTDLASTSQYDAQDWRAAVSAVDDNNATSTTHTQSSIGQELLAFLSMALNTFAIPYGSLEPGDRTDPLAATTTIRATGNVGIDERLSGESMCTTYTSAVTCPNSATSTISEGMQVFSTSVVTYATASTAGRFLSSTTQKLLDLNVRKSTSTTFQAPGITYWGIEVPATLTLAGTYTGENTFYGVVSAPGQW